jgi:hypothetical protein
VAGMKRIIGCKAGLFNCRVAAYLNKALHRTAIPLRSIAAGELGHSAFEIK